MYIGEIDHGMLNQQLIVSADTYKQCMNVTISNDGLPEDKESFLIPILSIRHVASSTYQYQAYNTSAMVTIIDDDCKYYYAVGF